MNASNLDDFSKDQLLVQLLKQARDGASYPARLEAQRQIADFECQNTNQSLVSEQIDKIRIEQKQKTVLKAPQSINLSFEQFQKLLLKRHPGLQKLSTAQKFLGIEMGHKVLNEYHVQYKQIFANMQKDPKIKNLFEQYKYLVEQEKANYQIKQEKVIESVYEEAINQLEKTSLFRLWDDPHWNVQNLKDAQELAVDNFAQAVPVFLENSLLRDHVLYLQYKKHRSYNTPQLFRMSAAKATKLREEVNSWSTAEKTLLWELLDQETLQYYFTLDNFKKCIDQNFKTNFKTISQYVEQYIEKNCKSNKKAEAIWEDEPYATFSFFGEIGTQKDPKIKEILLNAKAKGSFANIEVPTYRSWAKIEPVGSLKTKIEQTWIEYAPHYTVPNTPVEYWNHRLTFKGDAALVKKAMKNVLVNQIGACLQKDIVAISESEKADSIINIYSIYNESVLEKVQYMVDSGKGITTLKDDPFCTGENKTYTFYVPSEDQIEQTFYKIAENKWIERQSKQGIFPSQYDTWQNTISSIDQYVDSIPLNFSVSFETKTSELSWKQKSFAWIKGLEKGLSKNSKESRDAFAKTIDKLPKANTQIKKLLWSAMDLDWFAIKSDLYKDSIEKNQTAPFSERGILKVYGDTPENMLNVLHQLEILDFCQYIPTKWLENNRVGRLNPKSIDYSTGKHYLSISPECRIIHGMTGTRGIESALNRLKSILKTGGLKSIAERRRMGLRSHSMSPLGDIASGMDVGVPCKIGTSTTYGDFIWFSIKPEALQSRDVWFSDRDFGPGHSRYEEYNQYAKQLGHDKFYHPHNHASRSNHLETAHTLSHNEVWFKHNVPIEHIDTIYVAAEKEIVSLVDNIVKSHGYKDIKVIEYNKNHPFSKIDRVVQHAEVSAFSKLQWQWDIFDFKQKEIGLDEILLFKIEQMVSERLKNQEILLNDIIEASECF